MDMVPDVHWAMEAGVVDVERLEQVVVAGDGVQEFQGSEAFAIWALGGAAEEQVRVAISEVPSFAAALAYPMRFKGFLAFVIAASMCWVSAYVILVPAGIRDTTHIEGCDYNERFSSLPTHAPNMMCIHFLGFACTRALLFVPGVAAIYREFSSGGFARMCCAHACFDWPMYNFLLGIWIVFFQVTSSPAPPACEARTPGGHAALVRWTLCGCMLSIVWLALVCWQNVLPAVDAVLAGRFADPKPAPERPAFQLEELRFDAGVLGDGTPYLSTCAICLSAYEDDDIVKVTSCRHAFHAECLDRWLRTAQTCALCRQDLTRSPPPSAHGPSQADATFCI